MFTWKLLCSLLLLVGSALAEDADQTCDNKFEKPDADAKYASNCYFPSSQFLSVPVIGVRDETHNSKIITFGLPVEQALNHIVSSAILMQVPKDDGKFVARPYNPIHASEPGSFELLIKLYTDGVAGTYVSSLKVGDQVGFKQTKGNIKKFQFPFAGVNKLTMVAGGTGIAPMYQALVAILESKETKELHVSLLYSNKTPDDIMLKKELDALADKYATRLAVHFVVGDEEFDTRHEAFGETGWIDEEKMQRLGFEPSAGSSIVWVCGVDDMYNSLAGSRFKPLTEGSILQKLGFTDETVWRS
mmetsp:Transcript_13794/g.22843  ORF Transcript_13794/g.22843 Transcript_13794/m.22843 type:complete len:302 (-) Transcript_13794:97-1002(-)